MPPISRTFFHNIISRLLIMSFNSPPTAADIQSISNPNTITTTTTSLPSPPNNIISPAQSDHPILSFNPSHDLDSGNQPSPIHIPNNINIELPEWKRIGKFVQTVSFGGIGGFIGLLVKNPASATTNPALYIAYHTFVFLGLASSICLSAYSVINEGSPTVGLVQKKLIYFILLFVVLACSFHIHLGFVIVLVLIGLLVIVLYLLLSSRSQRQSPD